jgi:protein-S-isoprenylcysteine O-methyltransferase Ste14
MCSNNLSGEHPYGDIGQIIAFILFLSIWIIDSFIFRLSTMLVNYISLHIRLLFAVLLFVLAGYLVRSAHQVIFNKAETPSQVISTGAFSRVRHPMYLGIILFYTGLFFTTFSLFSLAFLVIIFLFYNSITSFEEKKLEQKFGKEYRKYKEMTPKWLP